MTLMTVVMAVTGSVVVAAAPAHAASCFDMRVTYNGYERGRLEGLYSDGGIPCFYGYHDGVYRANIDFVVCDDLDEPNENNVVEAALMVAYQNASGDWHFEDEGVYKGPGDGAGCRPYYLTTEAGGGRNTTYAATYLRFVLTAPGKASTTAYGDLS